eukprot:m.144388 g.144388  ORF g.144388 m.144388 type:complete len:285 (+) comp16767_c0_seq1:34-888(+)
MPGPEKTGGWGDEVEEAVAAPQVAAGGALPAPRTITEDGVKKVISYSHSEDGKIRKSVRHFRVEIRKELVNPEVINRRKLPKFGLAKGLPPGPNPATTSIGDDVYLVLRNKQETATETAEPDIKAPRHVTCRICKGDHWTTKCPYKDNVALQPRTEEAGSPAEPAAAGGPAERTGGRYVPPSMRGAAGGRGESMGSRGDDSATVRVTNLSENTREEDVRELFRQYGTITRVYLASDRDTGQCRGFAFVSFLRKEDAQKAIDNINGHGYDHLILRVEWSRQNTKE